eukprot:150485_1
MSVGKIPRTEFIKTQSYGSSLKSNIYERNEKFVRIADLMIPDENVDKLRNQSRRGSRISNYSSRGRAESNYSVSGKTNKTIDGIFVFDIDKHIIRENIKIDPSDPSAFENLDYAKQTYNNNIWNSHNRINTNATVITNNNMNEISNITHNSQITEMIRKQENEYELKIENVNVNVNNDNLIQYQSSSEKPDIIEIKEQKEEEKNGMNLRDFKSLDGKITYTEIEVSILRTGNFFGETSLMDERKENDNDNGYEYLNGNTPISKSNDSKDINFARIETGATTYNNNDIPIKNTSLKTGAPSIYDILNNKYKNKNKKERISNKISRAQTISLVSNNNKSNKKKQKNISTKKVSYGGSHTTFRCITSCVIYSITKQSLDEFFDIVPSARRWFDIMLSKYNVSLDTVLHIPRAARYFTLFLESEYAEENIHYVLSVNEYKEAFDSTSFDSRMEMAQIICNHFISDDGKQQINVSYHQRKLILDKINKSGKYITKNMFDITQKAIYILLERDCFPRFKQSHFFHEFLNEAENLALLTKEQYEKELKQEQEIMNNNKHKQSIIQKNNIYKIQKVKLNYDPKNNYKNKFTTIDEIDNNNNNNFDNDRITRAKTVI